jgi:hypothetical protein
MYMNESSHRFPALVLAAGLTTAVVIGLSALAQSRATMAAPVVQVVATSLPYPKLRSRKQTSLGCGSTWSLPARSHAASQYKRWIGPE